MTTPTATDPVPPWDATVAGVQALIPEARIYADDVAIPAGHRGITEGQVRTWLAGLSGRAGLILDGWERLSSTPAEGELVSDRDKFVALARDAVQNGAASYAEAARYPEQQAKSSTSYASVLWARYTGVLEELGAWLERRLNPENPDAPPPTEEQAASEALAGYFPPPSFTADLRF